MITATPTVLHVPLSRHWRSTEDDDFYSCGIPAQHEEAESLDTNPRERILANFRVLARTNVFLRGLPARSASGD
jgi:hypothetical protein